MARKKRITLASTTVHDFHDLDASRLARIREQWQGPDVTPLGLCPRPEREYSEDLLLLTLHAGSENGFNPNRSHYRKILHGIVHAPTQMGLREARALWLVETRPEKFSTLSSPRRPTDDELDKTLSTDEVRDRFAALIKDMESAYSSGYRPYDTQVILAALMSRLIGTHDTLLAWEQAGIAPHSFPNFFPYLMRPEDAAEEARTFELVREQQARGASSEYTRGAIAYCLFEDQAIAWCGATSRVYKSSTNRVICRLARCQDKWATALCSTGATLDDEDLFYEAIALATPEQVAELAKMASEVGGVNDCKRAMKRLYDVHYASLVDPMLSLYDNKTLGKLAETWLISEGANAIHGLALFARSTNKRGKICIDLLRHYRDLGHEDLIASVTDSMDASVQSIIHKHVLEHYSAKKETLETSSRPEWLTQLMDDKVLAKKSLPSFLTLETLPPLQTRDRALLSLEDMEWFVRALKASTLQEPHESIAHFRDWLDPWTTTVFAEALIDNWIRAGTHASYTWILESLGHVGNLYSPLMLEPLIKQWKHERADSRRALEECALTTLETLYEREQFATALAVIVRQNVSSKHVRYDSKATAARKARRDRLVTLTDAPWKYVKDLCIPKLGFNERGERDFDYGTRHFRLRLDEDLVPQFVDEQGNVSSELPHVRKSDDAEKAELAREAFRRDKALLSETLETLHARIEEHGQKKKIEWPIAIWERIFLHHPLTKNFSRMLLWRGRISRDGHTYTHGIFRITEDFMLVDVEDEDVTLKPKSKVELMPREGFTDAEREQWSNVLADYEIVQPFQQV